MDRQTVDVYEQHARRWVASREPSDADGAAAFGRWAGSTDGGGAPSVDLGCGPGWYAPPLPAPVVALDAARAMLDLVPQHVPAALRVQADIAALPFRRGALGSAWACRSYVHVARPAMPMALAELHRSLRVGAAVELRLFGGDRDHDLHPADDLGGRRFSAWDSRHFADVLQGAGFELFLLGERTGRRGEVVLKVRALRLRTLADTVGPGMRLLVCGLNPSLYAADAGVGYARPGNRFWPAARAAGLLTIDRDPVHALRRHGVGFTDLVKRATVAASELRVAEYRQGVARVERLCEWLRPGAVAFVGLAGWRAAVDREAVAGPQPRRLGRAPVYLMPSTSGLNTRSSLGELTDHVRAAAALSGIPAR